MKKLYKYIANSQGVVWMLGIWLFSTPALKAQTNIPDPNFAAAIRAACPTCIDANNRLLAPAATLTSLSVTNKNITNLSGIGGFTNLQILDCQANALTSLPTLPINLQRLICGANKLTSLPSLPINLWTLNCDRNQLTSIPFLPNSLQVLDCQANRLTSLPPLPNNIQVLWCNLNQLSSLPSLPNSLQDLSCTNNQLNSLPTLPTGLQTLTCYNNQIYCLLNLPNGLKYLKIDEDRVICLPNNPAGLKIYGRNDNLISLPICTGMTISTTNTTGICPGNSVELLANKCREIVKWSDGQMGNTITVKPTSTTTYTATCINLCNPDGLYLSNPVTITVLPTPPQPTIAGNNAFCENGTTKLTVNNAGSYQQFRWLRNGQNINANQSNLEVSEEGNYTVEVSVNGCSATSANFKVQQSKPSVKITGHLIYCQDSRTTLNADVTLTTDKPITAFNWQKNGQNVGSNASSISSEGPGNYSITVTDQLGCKATSSTVNVVENSRPVATLPTLPNLTGTETQTIKAMVSSGTAPYSYAWSAEPNVNFNSNGDNATFGPFTQTTQIKLRVSDAKGCQSDEIKTPLTYIPCTLSAGIQSQSFFFCKGTLPLASTVQNGNDGYSYQWRKDNTPIGSNTAVFDVSEGGQYSVVITDKKGCRSTSGTVSVTKGNPSVQIMGKLEFCAGGSTLLKTTTQNAKAPINYKWQGGSTTDSLRVGTAGNYTVEITDAQGCLATSTAVTVVQNPLPVANAGTGKNVTCAETYALSGVSTATGGSGNYQYAWSSSPSVAIQGPTAAQPTLGPFVENTTVSVRVTDAKGCVGTAQSTVTYIPPDLNVTLTGASEFCSGKSVPLKATIEKANLPLKQLVWYNDSQEVKRDSNEWTTNQKGNYTVFVEDNKGCRKTSNILAIAENPTPAVSITGSSFYCYSSNTTLLAKINSGTPPFKHQWQLNGTSTGTDSPTLTTATEGSYKLFLNDAKGCTAEAPMFALVEKGGELIAQITPQGPLSVYAPEKVLLVATLGKEYQYQWKRDNTNIVGANGGAYTAEQSGSYAVVVSRGECSRTSAAVVVKVEVPTSLVSSPTNHWRVWPNPASDKLSVLPPAGIVGELKWVVVDLTGQKITEAAQIGTSQMEIDTKNWPVGQYILFIVTPSHPFTTKIVKQ